MRNVCFFTVAIFFLASCSRDLKDLNVDPNRPKEVNPGVMLGQLQYRLVNQTVQAARNFTHELMQVDAPRSSNGGNGLHRYVVNPGAGLWSGIYNCLTDVEDIYAIAHRLNEPNYKAIALVYKSWAYSILTDLYGDVPYTQATRAAAGVVKPAFDKQKDIYLQLLKNLDTANALFNPSRALTYGGDMVFQANVLSGNTNPGIVKWKKFANSLKLRLLLRISRRNGEVPVNDQINAILANPQTYPVMASNSDDAIFRYPGSFPYFNPYFNARQLDWRDGTYFTEYLVNRFNAIGDPRRGVWMTTVQVNGVPTYRGIQSGYPTTTEYLVGQNSSYQDALKTLSQLGVMMPFAEVEFIKAELAIAGFNTGKTPKQHYEAGIAASMTQWGTSLPAGYLTQPGVAYDVSAPQAAQLEQIIQQKYYALFFVDYQSWFDKRRTGFPVLPRGAGIPAENGFPWRVPYPTYLQSLNPENLAAATASMGGDNQMVKVWWDR